MARNFLGISDDKLSSAPWYPPDAIQNSQQNLMQSLALLYGVCPMTNNAHAFMPLSL